MNEAEEGEKDENCAEILKQYFNDSLVGQMTRNAV
jgi:hypothetical protein